MTTGSDMAGQPLPSVTERMYRSAGRPENTPVLLETTVLVSGEMAYVNSLGGAPAVPPVTVAVI